MRIRVIGVGNLLLGDEGFGVHAIRALEEQGLPPEVELMDAGTAGLGLLSLLEDVDKVIIIDAADMSSPPGTIRRFRPEDVRARGADGRMSLHETGLLSLLVLAEKTGCRPGEVIIYGVQPQSLDASMELSPACRDSLEPLVAMIRKEICPSESHS